MSSANVNGNPDPHPSNCTTLTALRMLNRKKVHTSQNRYKGVMHLSPYDVNEPMSGLAHDEIEAAEEVEPAEIFVPVPVSGPSRRSRNASIARRIYRFYSGSGDDDDDTPMPVSIEMMMMPNALPSTENSEQRGSSRFDVDAQQAPPAAEGNADVAGPSGIPSHDDSQIPMYPPFIAYLQNIGYILSEDDVRHFFRGLSIRQIRLPINPKTRCCLGFADVEFATREDFIDALLMNKLQLHGRSVRITHQPPPSAFSAATDLSLADSDNWWRGSTHRADEPHDINYDV